MGTADSDGLRLPYTVDGDGDRRLVFAHGLMGVASLERVALKPLVDDGWTVVTFSQRGHADATAVTDPSGYDPDAMGEDLWAVADAAGFDRCWIGGGSMGAATSFRAAVSRPERVEGLIQVVPAIRDTEHPMVWVFDLLADKLRDEGMDGYVAFIKDFITGSGGTAESAEEFAEALRVHDPASLECALRSVSRWVTPDVPSGFADLPFPVIVLGMAGDPIHPLQTARDVAAAAGVDLIEGDPAAVQADRAATGRLLARALQATFV
jgi:pimeloyl-ACP methyl ester carboxylesterase